jgi:hypothetical protein
MKWTTGYLQRVFVPFLQISVTGLRDANLAYQL